VRLRLQVLHLVIGDMNNYFKTLRTQLGTLWGKVRDKAAHRLQRFRPREPDAQVPIATLLSRTDVEVPHHDIGEDFRHTLLAAAERRVNPDYSPLGNTHELSSAMGLYFLSQARDYLVYTPPGYRLDEALPVVVVLHGCKQTHLEIRANSGFDEIADRERFIVVYPFVTRYFGLRNLNCWGWWQRYHIRAGTGEVEDLHRIIEQVQQEFTVDEARIHIVGLSSGAAMSVAALVAHGRLFASGASVAGVAYGESARAVRIHPLLSVKYRSITATVARMKHQLVGKGRLAPLLVIQSQNDQTVELQSGLNLRDSWLRVKGVSKQRPEPLVQRTQGIEWQYRQYQQEQQPTPLETLLVEQVKHGWVGGNSGKYSDSRGPNISEIIWLFFKRHPRL